MRLIDADVQVKYFEGLARSLANVECFAAADATQCAAETLRIAPTIDAEPVRRGEWIEPTDFKNGFWLCSACHFCTAATAAHILYNYCPNCGAKMRGENECSDG